MVTATLLLIGDVHLGRRPAHLPVDLAEYGISPADLTPGAGWRRAVQLALETRVDAVVLAGDVVESENARFEAFGPLHDGVRELTRAGIAVFAVAGNHDVEALPRLARAVDLDGFRLLGREGRWESAPVLRDGRPVARLLGWSFPSARYPASPLALPGLPLEKEDDLPLLGLLHCDLSSPASPHAPVTRGALERTAADAWFLGHLHGPSDLAGPRPVGYLGSLVGLDPSETGPHGPWVARVGPGRPIEVEQLPLAPLEWAPVEIDVAELDQAEGIDAALRRAVERLHAGRAARAVEARGVGCRLILRGRTAEHGMLRRRMAREDWRALRMRLDGVLYFVERVEDRSRPALALESLRGDDDPPALLAARLLALERGDESSRSLVRRARVELVRAAEDRAFGLLDPAALDDEAVRRLLVEAGTRALETLLEQEGR